LRDAAPRVCRQARKGRLRLVILAEVNVAGGRASHQAVLVTGRQGRAASALGRIKTHGQLVRVLEDTQGQILLYKVAIEIKLSFAGRGMLLSSN
jgi:hypothetical protein